MQKISVFHDSVIVDPTLLRTNASGNSCDIRWIAFQPVQCIGTSTSGLMRFNSSLVCSMIFSK
jgi:hypothetical protein